MKKQYLCLVLLMATVVLAVSCACHAHADEEFDVRRVRWGMDRETVKASEQNQSIKEDISRLIYREDTFDTECYVVYNFDNDGLLFETIYFFKPDSEPKAEYIFSLFAKRFGDQYEKLGEGELVIKLFEPIMRMYKTKRTTLVLINFYRNSDGGEVAVSYKDNKAVEKELKSMQKEIEEKTKREKGKS